MGGSVIGSRQSFPTVASFNPATGLWKSESDMLFATESFGCDVINGKICAIGGTTAADPVLNAFAYSEVFAP